VLGVGVEVEVDPKEKGLAPLVEDPNPVEVPPPNAPNPPEEGVEDRKAEGEGAAGAPKDEL